MNRSSPYLVWLVIAGAGAFLHSAIYAVTNIYFVNEVGMNPLELILVGTAMEGAVFLFEIPTGVVADVYSRRASVILGVGLYGLTVVVVGLFPSFPIILAAYFAGGVAVTFISGAVDAWLADEIGTDALGPAYFRSAQIRYAGALLGIASGVALATVDLSLPIVLGGCAMVVEAGWLALRMPETGFRPTPREGRSSWQAMGATFRSGVAQVRTKPALAGLLAVAAFMGMYSEGVDRLSEPLLLREFRFPELLGLAPVVWLGALRAGALLLGIGGTEIARRWVDPTDPGQASRALSAITAAEILGTLGFGLASRFELAVAWMWLAAVARSSAGPIYRTWLQKHLDSDSRATVISMSGQMDALGQITGGPAVGAIGSAVSIRAALVTSGLVLSPALWIYTRFRGRGADS